MNVETRVVQERAIRSLGFVVVSSVLKNVFYFVGDFIRKENKVRKSEPSPWKQPRCRPFKAFASRNKRENPTFGKDKFKRFVNKIGLKEVFCLEGNKVADVFRFGKLPGEAYVFFAYVQSNDFTPELLGHVA